MYIPVSRIHPASLTRAPHPEAHAAAEAPVLSFSETLAAVAAAIEDQARRIRKRYGVSVRITAAAQDSQRSKAAASSDGQPEIVIAPNILQQMSKETQLQRRIYGYIEEYAAGRAGPENLGPVLIIDKDGNCNHLLPQASAPEEAVKENRLPYPGQADLWSGGGSTQDRLQQLAVLRARRAGRRH
ncbi:hypothetical protein [Paenibacillus sp. MMS20-IR301]|uniref:hypothetical protein n=1 Tax=Paenibacillus sp. MMS20-IR301 TaxID=2895946 RepID=UPI0028EDBDB9|nr:hypothetical protein [Paenibacillus sp. MMS20-IR301]WNS42411.1 hypothetical protein LOS79_26040 [Paenibacillus sp. MMS20-IR301]